MKCIEITNENIDWVIEKITKVGYIQWYTRENIKDSILCYIWKNEEWLAYISFIEEKKLPIAYQISWYRDISNSLYSEWIFISEERRFKWLWEALKNDQITLAKELNCESLITHTQTEEWEEFMKRLMKKWYKFDLYWEDWYPMYNSDFDSPKE